MLLSTVPQCIYCGPNNRNRLLGAWHGYGITVPTVFSYHTASTIATSRRYCSSFTIATRGIIIPGMRFYKLFFTPFSLLTIFYLS
ncbi:hypothetical protein ACN38_g7540 [Penicillium nordicum]|uniref:Uncharacterized protein n=1 Tax=Penicillium nordicum TaxID=229535 RepID=A0A0M9WEB7_9EURO|nr:hypothetical protein ACN38_g7540 [Penicillium nordicum]